MQDMQDTSLTSSLSSSTTSSSTLMRRVSSLEGRLGLSSSTSFGHDSSHKNSLEGGRTTTNGGCNDKTKQQQQNKSASKSSSLWTWLSLPGALSLSSSTSNKFNQRTTGNKDEDSVQQQYVVEPNEEMLELVRIPVQAARQNEVLLWEEEETRQQQQQMETGQWSEKENEKKTKNKRESFTSHKFAAGRRMTKSQERWNAITMLPMSIYCFFHLFSFSWIHTDALVQAQEDYETNPNQFIPTPPEYNGTDLNHILHRWFFSQQQECFNINYYHISALPPLPLLVFFLGIWIHLPFSFIYHWKFAHKMDHKERLHHWSRRMDHSMIHFSSSLFAYSTSGDIDYYLACAIFAFHCMYHHFRPQVRPRSNHIRVAIAIISYSLPILRRAAALDQFLLFWLVNVIAMWLFSQYPIGGWSHAAFHLVMGFSTPILTHVACQLPISQPQIQFAAQCLIQQQSAQHSP